MICPNCHHRPSCRFDGAGMQCHCGCHDLADKAPELWVMTAQLAAEATAGFVYDRTARKAVALCHSLENGDTSLIIHKAREEMDK